MMLITQRCFLFQDCCNQLQSGTCSRSAKTALSAVTAHFQPAHDDVELAIALDLSLEAVEQVAFEFHDLSAAQAGHMDMVALRTSLIIVLFALHVHEVEFVDQALPLEQFQRAINRDSIHLGIDFLGAPQNLAGIEMLLRGFDNAENRAALLRHTQASRHQFGLQTARNLGLRQRHKVLKLSCNYIADLRPNNTGCRRGRRRYA